jgi:hypothetical protein
MKFLTMDSTGHSVEEFDTATKTGLSEAMARFEALVKEGNAPAKLSSDGNHTVNRQFDPDAEEYVFVSPLKGG